MCRPAVPGRRSIALLAVALLAVTAGCVGALDDGETDDGGGEFVEYAPAGSQVLVHVDGELLHDDETQTLVDRAVAATGTETTSEQLLEEATNETAVDPTAIDRILVFGEEADDDPDGDSVGIVVATDWSESELSTLLGEGGGEYETSTHADHTIYTDTTGQDPAYVGVIEDGTYVLGDEASVKAALEVANGGTESVSGPIREEYDAASGGLTTMVVAVPEDDSRSAGQAVDQFDGVEVVSSTYDTPDGSIRTDVTYVFSNRSSASEAADELRSELDRSRSDTDAEAAAELLENVAIETDDDRVSIVYENDVDSYVRMIETVVPAFVNGFGSQSEQAQAPAVMFEWEVRDGDAVATHVGGNELQSAHLSASAENGDRLSVTTAAETIQAGDEIVIEDGASADTIHIEWSGEGGQQLTIDTFSPPAQ